MKRHVTSDAWLHGVVLRSTQGRNMINQRNRLLIELEDLQKRRRDAVQAYVNTGDLIFWREVRQVSECIVDRLGELEEAAMKPMDCEDEPPKGLMVVEQ
jgi:hypothetical protein